MEIPYTVAGRPDTGLNNGKIGIWLFLASEVMLFGALFASYIMLRIGAPSWPRGDTILNVPLATLNTVVLITSSVTMVMAWASLMRNDFGKFRLFMGVTVAARLRLPDHQVLRVLGQVPRTSSSRARTPSSRSTSPSPACTCCTCIGGMAVNAYFLGPRREALEDGSGAVHQPGRELGPVLALRRPGLDLPVPDPLPALGDAHDERSLRGIRSRATTRLTSTGTSGPTSSSSAP